MQPSAEIVGKKALAAHLGWARTTLDRRLKTDPKFPARSRGDQSGGWEFFIPEVDEYLGERPSAAPPVPTKSTKPAPPIDKAQLRDAVAPALPKTEVLAPPRRSAHHRGEATARQRKDEADASLREDKLRQNRGELVDLSELRQVLFDVVSRLNQRLEALPDKMQEVTQAPDEALPGFRAFADDLRRDLHKDLQPLLRPKSDTDH